MVYNPHNGNITLQIYSLKDEFKFVNKVLWSVFNIACWAVFVQVNMWNDSRSFIVSELKELRWKKIHIVF